MLVGRDRELAVLDRAIAERGVVVISGEPGIGKTRLLHEVAARAGDRVAWGRMVELGTTPAYWPWIQILAALDGDVRLDARNDAPAERATLFEHIAKLVCERATALLFDDVHAADLSSLQLLDYVLPRLRGRVLVVLATRDTDASPEVAAALARLQRGALRLPVSRLQRDDVRAIVGERDADRIFELSAGNPLFVEELAASGVLGLPPLSGVRAVLRERFARLPDATRDALAFAAIVGREVRGALLGELQPALAPAVRLGVLAEIAPDRYRFSHALIAEAIVDDLEPAVRRELHLRVAARLETDDASTIAHHLLAAGPSDAAVDAAERAAAIAMARLAFEDAAEILARALAIAPRRAALMCARAEALQHAGQHALAAELCDEAAVLARELGDAPLLARIALARGLEMRYGRTDAVLVGMLREALPGAGTLRARVLARLAAAEQPASDPLQPVALALEAIELARTLPDRERLDVIYVATAALIEYIEPARLDPILADTLALASSLHARVIVVHTLLRQCFAAMQHGDRTGFERAREVYASHATALGLARWMRHSHMLDATSALLDGRFADAEAAAARAEALDAGDANAAWLLAIHRSHAAALRTTPIPDIFRTMILSYPPGRGILTAWIAMQGGDREAARVAVRELRALPIDTDLRAFGARVIAYAGDDAQVAYAYDLLPPGEIVFAGMVGYALVAIHDHLRMLLLARLGRPAEADAAAEAALATAARLGSPPWIAQIYADWADLLEPRDRTRARASRSEALAIATRLDMPGLVARCAGAPPPPARVDANLAFTREGALWIVRGFGEEIHVKGSRGLDMIARLVGEPGRELHALDLSGSADAEDSDAGPMLDAKARTAYRARIADLVAERDEAEAFADAGRLARVSAELDALTAELERAFGLGGRERKAGAASERARSNVQRRITHAIDQIRAASPRLGEHLAATIRTGTLCVYRATGGGGIR